MNRTQVVVNKSVSFGLSILEISKIVMYELYNDYGKPKGGKTKPCYVDTNIRIAL